MSEGTTQRLSGLATSLVAHAFDASFESAMLQELSALLHSSHLAVAYRRNNSAESEIELCELRDGKYDSEVLSGAALRARLGVTFDDTLRTHPTVMRISPEKGSLTAAFFALKHYDCIIAAEKPENDCPTEDILALFNTIMEPLLDVRCSVKDAMRTIDLNHERYAGVRHKLDGAVSSVSTAIEMLLSLELSDEDRDELRKLARRGVMELTDIIDDVTETARQEQGRQT